MKRAFTLLDTFLAILLLAIGMLCVLNMAIVSRTAFYGEHCSAIAYREAANFRNIVTKYDRGAEFTLSSYNFPFMATGATVDTTNKAQVTYAKAAATALIPVDKHKITIKVPLPGIAIEDAITHEMEVYRENIQ